MILGGAALGERPLGATGSQQVDSGVTLSGLLATALLNTDPLSITEGAGTSASVTGTSVEGQVDTGGATGGASSDLSTVFATPGVNFPTVAINLDPVTPTGVFAVGSVGTLDTTNVVNVSLSGVHAAHGVNDVSAPNVTVTASTGVEGALTAGDGFSFQLGMVGRPLAVNATSQVGTLTVAVQFDNSAALSGVESAVTLNSNLIVVGIINSPDLYTVGVQADSRVGALSATGTAWTEDIDITTAAWTADDTTCH
jgi:hypothetical protein